MHSTLSIIGKVCFEERNGRRGARLLGFVVPTPITMESRLRKWTSDDRDSSPDFSLTSSRRRTVRELEVLPIPPAPMRTAEVPVLTNPRISPTISSHPRNNLGAVGVIR